MRRVATALVVVLLAGACSQATVEETTTTTTAATTSSIVSTTTPPMPTAMSSTTSTTMPTTTTGPKEPPSFRWGMGVADIGPLAEPRFTETESLTSVVVSGEFVDAFRQDVELSGEAVSTWFVRFSFGSHPVTGEEILGVLFIGPDEERWGGVDVWRIVDGRSTLDPVFGDVVSDERTIYEVPDFVAMLDPGRLYPVQLIINPPTLVLPYDYADWCETVWRCKLIYYELYNEGVYNVTAYNNQLHAAMLGESVSPMAGFGSTLRIDLLPVYPPVGPIDVQEEPSLLESGITVVVSTDCPLCAPLLERITAAAPNMPVHQIDLGGEVADELGAVSAPTVFVADEDGPLPRMWAGWAAINYLDDLIGMACEALEGTGYCDGLTGDLP